MSRPQIIAILSAIGLFLFILELVRRRRLREEYSLVWLLSAFLYLSIAIFPQISIWISRLIGTENTSIAFVFLGLQFVILLLLQYSVRLSRLTDRVKDLTQLTSILDGENKRLEEQVNSLLEDKGIHQ
jgi:hypothetical protein